MCCMQCIDHRDTVIAVPGTNLNCFCKAYIQILYSFYTQCKQCDVPSASRYTSSWRLPCRGHGVSRMWTGSRWQVRVRLLIVNLPPVSSALHQQCTNLFEWPVPWWKVQWKALPPGIQVNLQNLKFGWATFKTFCFLWPILNCNISSLWYPFLP